MRIKPILATLIALTTLVGISACSDSDKASAEFNNADVTFAQEMIPHHRQATEMAGLAEGRTENAQVLELADKIEAAQEPEIETMTGWLKSWDKEVPSDSGGEMEGMDHGSSSSDMPGMMSDEDMAALKDASGAAFDKQFLTMMIEHHEGAVEMAKTEISDGKDNDAVDLAKKIQNDQEAEITTMKALLQS